MKEGDVSGYLLGGNIISVFDLCCAFDNNVVFTRVTGNKVNGIGMA